MPSERYGSDIIVDMLRLYGVQYAALNPGSSYRGLHDSIVNYGGNQPEIIECPHEKIAVGIAHGYARVTGKPMAAIVHNLVGLLHGTMGIYYAYVDQAPVIVLGATGPMDTTRRRPYTDWIHTAQNQGDIVRNYTKWDDQPHSVRGVPDSFARAYRVATTPPFGPVYLCYDCDLQEEPLEADIPLPDPSRLAPPEPTAINPRSVETIVQQLLQAEHPVVLVDRMGQNPKSVVKLVELAELLALPVVDARRRFNFPSTHPLNLTGSKALEEADLILALDVKDFGRPFTRLNSATRETESVLRPGCRVIDIGYRDTDIKAWSQEFQVLTPVDLSFTADTSTALTQILEAAGTALGKDSRALLDSRAQSQGEVHRTLRQSWHEQSRAGWDSRPMTTARLAAEVWQAIKDEDWVMTGSDLAGWTSRLWEFTKPDQYPGNALGTATQFGLSLGVALAHKGSSKLVVSIQPDGDLMFDASSLWIATHHQIPMLVVMYNNRAYYNDWEHQEVVARFRGRAEENAFVGMEINNPAPDFARIAQAFGWYAEGPIEDPNQLALALRRAIQIIKETGQPALIDALTQMR